MAEEGRLKRKISQFFWLKTRLLLANIIITEAKKTQLLGGGCAGAYTHAAFMWPLLAVSKIKSCRFW